MNGMDDRVLALGGMLQALAQVRRIADTGQSESTSVQVALDSVFRIDAADTAAVYGDAAALRLGGREGPVAGEVDRHRATVEPGPARGHRPGTGWGPASGVRACGRGPAHRRGNKHPTGRDQTPDSPGTNPLLDGNEPPTQRVWR